MNKRAAIATTVMALVVVAVLVGVGSQGDGPDRLDPATQAAGGTATDAGHTSGMTATIDPQTGEFTTGAAVGDAGERTTSSAPLVQEQSPVEGGGVMIDLQGQFQSRVSATISDSDSITVNCEPDDNDHQEEE